MEKAFLAKTLFGLEQVLAAELLELGAKDVQILKRAVSFKGDQALLYRANFCLRTALRILLPIKHFVARDERMLYKGVEEVDWSRWMKVTDSLAVDAIVGGDIFRHSQYAAQLTKDAVVDQFRAKFNRRPNVNIVSPTLKINLHIQGSSVDLSLDASGDSLHMRGYRRDTVEAPLNEVLAAGMIALSGWKADTPFVDAMCGSGTLPIEAALRAKQIPSQFRRESFAFMKWPDFDSGLWARIRESETAKSVEFPHGIYAVDKDPRARNATSLNLLSAGLEKFVRVEKQLFEKWTPPEPPGILILNPPYDERLALDDAVAYYKGIGDVLKKHWQGWTAWIISANREALKHTGLKASQKISLLNGGLEAGFHEFKLW